MESWPLSKSRRVTLLASSISELQGNIVFAMSRAHLKDVTRTDKQRLSLNLEEVRIPLLNAKLDIYQALPKKPIMGPIKLSDGLKMASFVFKWHWGRWVDVASRDTTLIWNTVLFNCALLTGFLLSLTSLRYTLTGNICLMALACTPSCSSWRLGSSRPSGMPTTAPSRSPKWAFTLFIFGHTRHAWAVFCLQYLPESWFSIIVIWRGVHKENLPASPPKLTTGRILKSRGFADMLAPTLDYNTFGSIYHMFIVFFTKAWQRRNGPPKTSSA